MNTFLYFCIMISRNNAKLIRSLATKKGRLKAGLFVAEGPKVVGDLIHAGFTPEWLIEDEDEARQVSFLQHPQGIIGVFPIPKRLFPTPSDPNKLAIALDGVQDPGNVGTIIRIADWFGITNVFCSHQTADCWSPKVVQATMGSIARVNVHYVELAELISQLPNNYPVYGTMLDGKDIYHSNLTRGGLIVMGNEGNGITPEVERLVSRKLRIPNYPAGRETADSLNVAIATAITCAEFRRRALAEN